MMRIKDVNDEFNRSHTFNNLFDLYAQRDLLLKECKKSFAQAGFGSYETFSRWNNKKSLELEETLLEIKRMESVNIRLDQMRDDLITLYIAKHGNYDIHSGNQTGRGLDLQ